MNHWKRLCLGGLALLALLTISATALAAGVITLPAWTVDGGGGSSQGGSYSLSGTLGQPDAALLAGGNYNLAGGFWPGPADRYPVYLPVVIR